MKTQITNKFQLLKKARKHQWDILKSNLSKIFKISHADFFVPASPYAM